MTHPSEQEHPEHEPEVKFRGWRLLGVIMLVVLVIAGVSALVDWIVIGPLDGRVG